MPTTRHPQQDYHSVGVVGTGRTKGVQKGDFTIRLPTPMIAELRRLKVTGELPDVSSRIELFLKQQILEMASTPPPKETTIQTTLSALVETHGDKLLRDYFRDHQQLAAEGIIISLLQQEYALPVTPGELSAVMYQHFRGIAHV